MIKRNKRDRRVEKESDCGNKKACVKDKGASVWIREIREYAHMNNNV